jgi:hypothetical protein
MLSVIPIQILALNSHKRRTVSFDHRNSFYASSGFDGFIARDYAIVAVHND